MENEVSLLPFSGRNVITLPTVTFIRATSVTASTSSFLQTVECYCSLFRIMQLQPGHYPRLTAPNLQPTTDQERNDQCGNQHHSRELLIMGIVMPETC